jgi:broad specificity phosphatase PhoE
MEILLVRHGETGGNVAHRHQSDATQLTDEGVRQIERVAKQLAEYAPTHVLSSSLLRAGFGLQSDSRNQPRLC